ncbi:hypothetical protein FPSE_07796 [Fusarium pseudograminearum CS3096]|uniref:Uncharacterized protein n=1 Tax=Fusarium pseudograminearum (strain CS3096) TaxID=1028729 RepID=K3VE10_FUSPC|nr:hypothetical protein FPSE_07796 [Fusarium pseudograminearum CS3096]EKJ72054.1 hypothetical protein FPSE_07796 [Fusarium pseudograminearum CS3096]
MAAPPSELRSITATPVIPIANRDETVALQIKVNTEVWNAANPADKLDGAHGSFRPIGLKLKKAAVLGIEGEANYPQTWPAFTQTKCLIIGSIKDAKSVQVDILKGVWEETKLADPAPRQAQILKAGFKTNLEVINPLGSGDDAPSIPWGFSGDVEWRIETQTGPKQTLLVKDKSRLEIYHLAGIAVGGPTETFDPQATLPNLQGKWPVNLLRIFMPNPTDIIDKAAEINANKLSWWAKLAIGKLSAMKVLYDTAEGRSSFGISFFGGSLDVNHFHDSLELTLNSFDLTCMLEAAFQILLSTYPAGTAPTVNWVGLTSCGAIADKTSYSMVPMGWESDTAVSQGLSTPFFKGTLGPDEQDGWLATNAWLEIKTGVPEEAYVVQAAFSVKEKNEAQARPDTADIKRIEFLKRHFKDSDRLSQNTGHFFDWNNTTVVPQADAVGNSLSQKVGLFNLRGVNEPWPWNFPSTGPKPPPVPLVEPLKLEINKILNAQGTKNNASTAKNLNIINSSSLHPSQIYPRLKFKTLYKGDTDYFRLVVARGVSVATYVVPLNGVPNTNARVKISTFETFSNAFDGLINELAGFESNLGKLIVPNDPTKQYGNYMVHTKRSLIFVRNNLLVDFTILGTASYGNQAATAALLPLAESLDSYLTASTVSLAQLRKAAFIITDPPLPPNGQPPTTQVIIDTPFQVTLANASMLAEELGVFVYSGQSNVAQPIIFTSAGPLVSDAALNTSTRVLEFLPVQKQAAMSGQPVDIAVSGAHYDTFYPVTQLTQVALQ